MIIVTTVGFEVLASKQCVPFNTKYLPPSPVRVMIITVDVNGLSNGIRRDQKI